jgi:hypothetical protein
MAGEEVAIIEDVILTARGQRVILAGDLARIYGVETRVLNQAVKRNAGKFPADFMLRLTRDEAQAVQGSRSQSVILKRGRNIKYLPYAFTEHGAIMAANLLNSPRAVQMSVFVVRAFVRLRQTLTLHKELAGRLADLERKVASHDEGIRTLFEAIRQLMAPPEKRRRSIGFRVEEARPRYRVRRLAGRGRSR